MRRYLILGNIPLGHATADWFSSGFWVLLPVIALDLDISLAQMGLLITVRTLFSALVYLPGGALADLVPRRALFMATTFWWVAAGYLLASAAPGLLPLIAFVALAETGPILFHPPALGTASQALPTRRGLGVALFSIGGSAAELASPAVMGALLLLLGWRQVLQVNAIPVFALGFFLLWSLSRLYRQFPPPHVRGFHLRQGFALLRGAPLQRVLAISILRFMAHLAILTFLSRFLTEDIGLSATVAAFHITLYLTASVIAAPILGPLSDRFGRRPVLVVGLVSGAVATSLIPNVSEGMMLALAIVAAGFFVGALHTVIVATAMDAIPRGLESAAIGPFFAILEGVAALAPLVAGAIAQVWGIEAALYFAATTLALALVFLAFRFGPQAQQPRAGQPSSG